MTDGTQKNFKELSKCGNEIANRLDDLAMEFDELRNRIDEYAELLEELQSRAIDVVGFYEGEDNVPNVVRALLVLCRT